MTRFIHYLRLLCITVLVVTSTWACSAPQLQLRLPLNRTCYQTNELVQLALVRSDAAALPTDNLILRLIGDQGSAVTCTFSLPAVLVQNNDARATEHVFLRGDLLRPGKYHLEAAVNGATAETDIEIYSHVRKSTFKLIDWASRAAGDEQAALGVNSLGFNVDYYAYGGLAPDALIRGGLDYMRCCTMGGGFQLDLRGECDWSDPAVLGGAAARVVRQAFNDRINPNCIGVHYYDEPMLTVLAHPATGKAVPHNIPAQEQAYKRFFGEQAPQYPDIKPDNPEDRERWEQYARWKTGFLEAAWRITREQLETVRPDYLSTNQSVWAWWSFSTGNYFNEARTLSVLNGHGGYDPQPTRYFTPSFVQEFGRMRETQKDMWYMPLWWTRTGNMVRLEHYLSFMHNVQGIMKPPDLTTHRPSTARFSEASPCAEGIVEANKTMERLGTIFTSMPPTKSDVAALYALSTRIDSQMKNFEQGIFNRDSHMMALFQVYLTGQLNGYPLTPVVEEDVLDGTLAANYKAVVLAGLSYLDPRIITALERFIARGGSVLLSDDCTVKIAGATPIGCAVDTQRAQRYYRLAGPQPEEAWDTSTAGGYLADVQPFARALQTKLRALQLKPVFLCDNPAIASARQAAGDIEYLFAVNTTPAYDLSPRTPTVGQLGHADGLLLAGTEATITLPDAGKPVYDAMLGGLADAFHKDGAQITGTLRFGPGQMRVFARTARPIGGVQVAAPNLVRDYTLEKDPLHVEIAATLVDNRGQLLAGSAPLRMRVIDPVGIARYDLYRATRQGVLNLSLPLAANDRPGRWQVEITELLANTTGRGSFTLATPADCPALAGAARRAITFGDDEGHIFRFFRTHQQVTIVKGTSAYNITAAERLAAELKPWGVRCTIVDATEVNKPREITPEEAATWCGPDYTSRGSIKPGTGNPISLVGFAVQGSAILLGTPEDNPLIGFVKQHGFLAYAPGADFPGRSRGMLAWQLDGIGLGQESVACIAYDAAGMSEAVGSLNEAAAGIRPLTPFALPVQVEVAPPAATPAELPKLAVAWQLTLPDRPVALKSLPNGDLLALGQDGTLLRVAPTGKERDRYEVRGLEGWSLDCSADGNALVLGSGHSVTFYQNGKLAWITSLPDGKILRPITFVTVSPDGRQIAAASENGKLALLTADNKQLWESPDILESLQTKWQSTLKAWTEARGNYSQALKEWEAAYARWQAAPENERGEAPKRPAQPLRPNRLLPPLHLHGIFTADGKYLVILTTEQAQEIGDGTYPVRTAAYARVLRAADGQEVARIDNIDPRVTPVRAGAEVLLAGPGDKITRISADGKISDALALPANLFPPAVTSPRTEANHALAGFAPTRQGLLIALEADGIIAGFPDGASTPKWTLSTSGLLTKILAARDGQAAIGYWDGLLEVIDTATGTPLATYQLTQDITALTWCGKYLIAGQADGRVLALRAQK